MAEQLEMSAAPAGPQPISANTNPNIPADEASVRALVMEAEAAGEEKVVLPQPGTQTVQATTPVSPALATPETPAKFVKPDGTVDVEKLQASTRQLDAAIQDKVLSVDEMVAAYKEKERQFRNLPSAPAQVAQVAQAAVQTTQPVMQPQVQPDVQALQAQLLADLNRDPVGTIIDIVKMTTAQQQKPVTEFIANIQEQQRDSGLKNTIAELAKSDPRIANPQIYAEIVRELESDPGYRQLKNPHKAAWNEVKARLRLGEINTPAQPSRPAAPILGGGTPPPVPSTTGEVTPLAINQAIGQMKTPQEISAVESELRRMMISAGM